MYEDILCHHGIKGQKWGVRRYQNPDGSLTPAGQARYARQEKSAAKSALRTQKKELYRSGDIRVRAGNRLQKLNAKQDLNISQKVMKQAQQDLVDKYYKDLDKTQKMVDDYVAKYGKEKIAKIGYKYHDEYGDVAYGNKGANFETVIGAAFGAVTGREIGGALGQEWGLHSNANMYKYDRHKTSSGKYIYPGYKAGQVYNMIAFKNNLTAGIMNQGAGRAGGQQLGAVAGAILGGISGNELANVRRYETASRKAYSERMAQQISKGGT